MVVLGEGTICPTCGGDGYVGDDEACPTCATTGATPVKGRAGYDKRRFDEAEAKVDTLTTDVTAVKAKTDNLPEDIASDLSDISDRCDDIMDKCNDIWEKLND